jgi:hypothetical protein
VLWPLVRNDISSLGECHISSWVLLLISLIGLYLPFFSLFFPLAPVHLATSNSSKSVKIIVGNIFTKCISMLLLRGLAANPDEDNAININQQDQSDTAKECVGPNPQVQGIIKNCINRSQASEGRSNQPAS